MASVVGLEGLTIGNLAERLGLSKSGLFAHFGSKDALQQAIIETGVDIFTDVVVRPALARPTGVGCARALFDGWVRWSSERTAGGCLFVTAAIELDDRPGPLREQLVEVYTQWLELIGGAAMRAVDDGDFSQDLDPAQFAHDFHAILLGFNQADRLLRDPDALAKATRALERLFRDAGLYSPDLVPDTG